MKHTLCHCGIDILVPFYKKDKLELRDLNKLAVVTPTTVSKNISLFVEEGILVRNEDGRMVILYPTEKGRALVNYLNKVNEMLIKL